MKKLLQSNRTERGFYFPLTLMVTLIILSVSATTILLYQNEQAMTERTIQQIKAETILQKAKHKFMQDGMYNERDNGEVNYEFPDGFIFMQFTKVSKDKIYCKVRIETNEQFILDTFTYLMIESY